jgi:hypothetical protein
MISLTLSAIYSHNQDQHSHRFRRRRPSLDFGTRSISLAHLLSPTPASVGNSIRSGRHDLTGLFNGRRNP